MHVTTVHAPQQMLSVVLPEGSDCQGAAQAPLPLATVRRTAARHGCIVASNGGFFNTSNGACIGNVVSDGAEVQLPALQNANFGIQHDGQIVVGYLAAADIAGGRFAQLVAGTVWLVRNGPTTWLSAGSEDLTRQETGATLWTCFGRYYRHDRTGAWSSRMSTGDVVVEGRLLTEFADMLVAPGVVNAINLTAAGRRRWSERTLANSVPTSARPLRPRRATTSAASARSRRSCTLRVRAVRAAGGRRDWGTCVAVDRCRVDNGGAASTPTAPWSTYYWPGALRLPGRVSRIRGLCDVQRR